jgi:hypothetical protein
LAEHSTDGRRSDADREGGEVTPKRPVEGKVRPGMTIRRREPREALRGHKPCDLTSVECVCGQLRVSVGSIVVRQTGSCLSGC